MVRKLVKPNLEIPLQRETRESLTLKPLLQNDLWSLFVDGRGGRAVLDGSGGVSNRSTVSLVRREGNSLQDCLAKLVGEAVWAAAVNRG
jgi:hypothetical protein